MTLTNVEMRAVVNAGGSVAYNGRDINTISELPSTEEIANYLDDQATKALEVSYHNSGFRFVRFPETTNTVLIPADVAGFGNRHVDIVVIITRDFTDGSGTNEIQTVTLGAGNTSGTFTLTYASQTTAALDFDASAAEVQTALIALSNIGPADVVVTGDDGGPFTVTFQGTLANTNVAQMTGTGSLVGGTNTVTIGTQTGGVIGAPPTFAIGETGNTTKFASINSGDAGDVNTYDGTLVNSKNLIVTITPAIGSGTGAIRVGSKASTSVAN